MSLFKSGISGNWSKIKVILVDLYGLEPELVITYIGDRHLQDEVNKWATHKGARYYHRLVKSHISNGSSEAQACKKVSEKFSSKITSGIVRKNYDVIEFMEKRNMGVKLQAEQYSYWIEYFQHGKNKNVRAFFNDSRNLQGKVNNPKDNAYDDMMVEKVTNDSTLFLARPNDYRVMDAVHTDGISLENAYNGIDENNSTMYGKAYFVFFS